MIGTGGEDSGFKKSNTVNRRMFIFAAAKAVIFLGLNNDWYKRFRSK